MHPTLHRSAARPGFTLVELIVSVGIVVVLIAILIPALGIVRDQARAATTQTLMTATIAASTQFETDNQRLPGVFTQEEICSGLGTNPLRLTATENAILDLAGGVVSTSDDANIELTLDNPDGDPRTVFINTARIGANDGPGYLELGSDRLRAIEGQLDDPEDPAEPRLPDIVDPFEMPLMLWSRNELAGAESRLAAIGPSSTTTAQFYLCVNGAYYNSPGLGERQVNQAGRSLLPSPGGLVTGGSFVIGASDELDTFLAVIGNPAFPVTNSASNIPTQNPLVPSQAKGSFILHSAGPDGIYLDDQSGEINRAAFVGTDTDFSNVSFGETVQLFENFDDIIRGGGS